MDNKIKIEVIKRPSITMKGEVKHEVTTTKTGNGWNIRVFVNNVLNQEQRVFRREHVGIACREMLRSEDKLGNISAFASAARHRAGRKEMAHIKIWLRSSIGRASVCRTEGSGIETHRNRHVSVGA